MIIMQAYLQGDGVMFCLDVAGRARFPSRPNRVFVAWGTTTDTDKTSQLASRWLLIASILTGLTETDVEAEGFEVHTWVENPAGRQYDDVEVVVPLPPSTQFLRVD